MIQEEVKREENHVEREENHAKREKNHAKREKEVAVEDVVNLAIIRFLISNYKSYGLR